MTILFTLNNTIPPDPFQYHLYAKGIRIVPEYSTTITAHILYSLSSFSSYIPYLH